MTHNHNTNNTLRICLKINSAKQKKSIKGTGSFPNIHVAHKVQIGNKNGFGLELRDGT